MAIDDTKSPGRIGDHDPAIRENRDGIDAAVRWRQHLRPMIVAGDQHRSTGVSADEFVSRKRYCTDQGGVVNGAKQRLIGEPEHLRGPISDDRRSVSVTRYHWKHRRELTNVCIGDLW
jgi:hypothetical protein